MAPVCNGEDGDIVFLAEFPGGFGDGLRGLAAEGLGSFKPVQFPTRIASFRHSVGNIGQPVAETQLRRCFLKIDFSGDPQRQPRLNV